MPAFMYIKRFIVFFNLVCLYFMSRKSLRKLRFHSIIFTCINQGTVMKTRAIYLVWSHMHFGLAGKKGRKTIEKGNGSTFGLQRPGGQNG